MVAYDIFHQKKYKIIMIKKNLLIKLKTLALIFNTSCGPHKKYWYYPKPLEQQVKVVLFLFFFSQFNIKEETNNIYRAITGKLTYF